MKSASWPKFVIAAGVFCAAAGVLFAFQLERHNFVTTADPEFAFLEETYFPILVFGLVLTFAGSVIWAWQAKPREVLIYGRGILILTPSSLAVIPVNIHDWTPNFMFVGADAMLIGGVLLLVTGIRKLFGHRRTPSPGQTGPVE